MGLLLTGGEGRKVGEKGKEWGGGEKGREEERHEPPSIKTKFTRAYRWGRGKGKERAGEGAVADLEPASPPPLWATNCMHDAITHGTHDT